AVRRKGEARNWELDRAKFAQSAAGGRIPNPNDPVVSRRPDEIPSGVVGNRSNGPEEAAHRGRIGGELTRLNRAQPHERAGRQRVAIDIELWRPGGCPSRSHAFARRLRNSSRAGTEYENTGQQ